MLSSLCRAVLVSSVFLTGAAGGVAETPSPLPSPQVWPVPDHPFPVPPYPYSYPRVSRYEVWQNYGVDHFGRFRPLVIYSPYGSYYRANHEPFPWVPTHTDEFMPYVVD
jgi:hypothetical protein